VMPVASSSVVYIQIPAHCGWTSAEETVNYVYIYEQLYINCLHNVSSLPHPPAGNSS
jgi:hypothetical protein